MPRISPEMLHSLLIMRHNLILLYKVSTTFSSLFIFGQYAQSQAGRTKTAGLGESAVLILEQN